MENNQFSPGKKAGPIQFGEAEELLDIRYDGIFKAVFTRDTPASKGALSGLISALIGRKVAVDTINANEPPRSNAADRRIRFDISCKAVSGELVNIEMSFNPNPYEIDRLEYYAARQYSGQEIQGEGGGYSSLAEAFQIAIIDKAIYFHDDALVHSFQYHDPLHDISLGRKSRIVTVELLKADRIVDKPATEMDSCEKWTVFFQYLTNRGKRGKINEILEREEGIAMAGETLSNITRDEIEQAWKTSELKYILDRQTELWYAKNERTLEIARKMKNAGKPISEIEEFTGLSCDAINQMNN